MDAGSSPASEAFFTVDSELLLLILIVQDFPPVFENVFSKWKWKSVRNCPGRFILSGGISELTLAEIAGADLPVFEFEVKDVVDRVFVMKFTDNGGLISYRKGENCFLHTLNKSEGFSRKLEQLGIKLQL